MAWVQSDIDAIDTAIKSNTLRVQFADRSVTYRSVQELLQIRAFAVTQVNAANGSLINRHVRVYTNKGFDS